MHCFWRQSYGRRQDRLLSEKDIECSEGNMEKAKSLKTRHQADAF